MTTLIFLGGSSTPAVSQITSPPAFANTNGTTNTLPPPPEDRYAALKDLDCMMKQASLKDEPISSKTPWNLKDTNNGSVNNDYFYHLFLQKFQLHYLN